MRKIEINNLEKLLKALSNKRRLGILRFLKKKKEANVNDISEDIKLSFKSTSKHLAILYAANIVEKEQRSLEMYYRLSPELHHIVKYISNSYE